MTFQEKLDEQVDNANSLLCVGLDSDFSQIPERFKGSQTPIFDFNQWIIDQTHSYVCAYKPNSAWYEDQMADGIDQLQMTTKYLHDKYPNIPVIIDAKRGDIGNTNRGYVSYTLSANGLNGDALTLHPYLGMEALMPFLELENKGFFVLCKTSNDGAGEFQDVKVTLDDGRTMKFYQFVAEQVVNKWNRINNNCMLVVGATYPIDLNEVRKQVGDMTLLVPGIGTQGGEINKVVRAGVNSQGRGIVVNSSREVIFDKGGNPAEVAKRIQTEINLYRES